MADEESIELEPEADPEHEIDEVMQEIESTPDEIPKALRKIIKSEDILADLTEEDVADIKQRVTDGYNQDEQSMKDYIDKYNKVLLLASMNDNSSGDKTFPFVGASKIMLPQLAKAAVEFNSRTVPEVVNRRDIATVKVWGYDDPVKQAKAERRSSAINWQLKKGIKGWTKRMDRALLLLPVVGMVFKKKWYEDGKIQECLITADRMIFDHDADSFAEAPRKSHWFMMDANVYESQVRLGVYAEIDAHKIEDKSKQPPVDKPLKLVESHCTLDLDHDGYCEPYIVTFCDCCDTVVRIVRRYAESDVECKDGQVVEIDGEEFFTQAGFIPDLEKAALYTGWGFMMYDALEAINTMMRQIIDAGTLNNTAMNSGFISSNLKTPGRSKKGRPELILGQLTPLDMGGGQKLGDMIWTPQFQGVSQSFYTVLQDLKQQIDQYTTASQSMDVTAGEAASLYLARLQQALKVPNAITSRVYESLSDEFQRISDLMKRYLPEDKYLEIVNWYPEIPTEVQTAYEQAVQQYQQMQPQFPMMLAQGMTPPPPPKDPHQVAMSKVRKDDDFADELDILTTADPSLGSEQERIARAEIIAERAMNVPGYDKYETEKKFLSAIGECDIDIILPKPNNEPDPMAMAQLEWTKADTERMKAEAATKMSEIQRKQVTTHMDERKLALDEAKSEADLEKTMSETMKNLAQIDLQTAGHNLQELQVTAEAAINAASQPVIEGHPEHGDISEDDIQATMQANNMSREQVIQRLHGPSTPMAHINQRMPG